MGRPQVMQKVDNCASMSLWSGMNYLYAEKGSKARYQEYRDIYTASLKAGIRELAPELSAEDMDTMLQNQTLNNPVSLFEKHGLRLIEKANNPELPAAYRAGKYRQAIEALNNYLTRATAPADHFYMLRDKPKIEKAMVFCERQILRLTGAHSDLAAEIPGLSDVFEPETL